MARYKVMNAGTIVGRNQRVNDIIELSDADAKQPLEVGNIVTANDSLPPKKAPANPTPEDVRVRDNNQRERDLQRGQPVTPEPKPTPEEAKRRAEGSPDRPFNPPRNSDQYPDDRRRETNPDRPGFFPSRKDEAVPEPRGDKPRKPVA